MTDNLADLLGARNHVIIQPAGRKGETEREIADRPVMSRAAERPESRHRQAKATAGPSADDRYGEGTIGFDIEARIIKVDVIDGRTRIAIACGDRGVRAGMEGYVKGPHGAELQIEDVKGGVAFAYVAMTPDQVQAGGIRYVRINPRPAPYRTRPVQRRAAGHSTAPDPSATARAGVAGAASRLPHFDPIQRAFGKHDVSQIRAQIGGPATDAAHALGASAYATGNTVAFASAPDLHTAAHEAAHVIQQQRGAVRVDGLGAADDEHERHADAVADAVVSGRSAEPLLDGLTRGPQASAVQKKKLVSGDPDSTKTAPADSTSARYHAVGAVVAAAKRALQGADARDAIFEATRHLVEASALIGGAGMDLERADLEALRRQVDDFSLALETYRASVQKSDQGVALRAMLRDLSEREQYLRNLLGLHIQPGPDAVSGSGADEPTDEANVVLELVRFEAARAYAELAHDGNRDAIIAHVSSALVGRLRYVRGAIARDPAASDHARQVEIASVEVLRLRRWVAGREANASLMSKLVPVVDELDGVRGLVGLGQTIDMDSPPVSQRVVESETAEAREVVAAMAQFEHAMSNADVICQLGAQRFEQFAALHRGVPANDKDLNLATQFLIVAAANLIAPGVGNLMAGFASAKAAQFITKCIEKVIKDKAKDVIAKAKDSKKNRFDSNQEIRERRYFAEAMVQMQLETTRSIKGGIEELVKLRQLGAKEVTAMASVATATAIVMADHAYRETAHAYAAMQAERGLKAIDDRETKGGASTDRLDNYFDEKGRSKKEGTTGVGKLRVLISQDGDTLKIQFRSFEIYGMNDDVALAVVERSGYRLDRLGLPVEIEIEVPRWGMTGSFFPTLVVNPDAVLRGSRDWDEIRRTLADKSFTGWTPPRDAKLIATPEACWDSIKLASLPAGIVKVTP